jgi:hypothetical protein
MGTVMLAHRLAWACYYGDWPEDQVDHINGNKRDNRIDNLRSVSNQENHKNCPMRRDNTSGVNGVYLDKRSGSWVARVADRYVGTFRDLNDAKSAVETAREHDGYTRRHGAGH